MSAPLRVLLHYAAGPGLMAQLVRLAGDDLQLATCGELDDDLLRTLLPTTDVLWHVLRPVPAALIDAAPRLRLIQKIGVGVNTIDLDLARARGIAVCNLPGSNAPAVAELALLLMLATLRLLPRFDAAVRAGTGWASNPALQDRLGELRGRTVGLVGYGAIPRLLAPVLVALGCRVLYASRTSKADAIGEHRSLAALLGESDIVSLHLPLTAETERLIDSAALSRMRPGAILINTARGGLVDQDALTEALATGRLAGAGLDTFVHEPVDPAAPLFRLPNVVLTPHIGWLTTGTFERSFALAAENCRRLRAGQKLLHRVV